MPTFYSRSIRKKLMFLFTATASLTVLVACAILWVYQFLDYRRTMRIEESAMAQLVAESSAPALLFGDRRAANQNLALLRADPRIQSACLYDKRGKVLAFFNAGSGLHVCPESAPAQVRFTRRRLIIFRSIEVQDEEVGSLYLGVELASMYSLLLRFTEIMVCVILMTSLFALVLSAFLQRLISGPILALTRVASQVSKQGNYLLRAQRFSDDEAGLLIDQFNAMMDHIQQREAELQQAQSGLEEKVKLRTMALSSEIAERKLIERDLGQAKLAAEESSRAKSAFLATMSHELRTPLNAIIGYSEILQEDAGTLGSTQMTEDLNKVLFCSRHLLELISDVLDLSKIEAGEMKVYPEPVLASSLLRDVLPTAEILSKVNHNELRAGEILWDGLLYVDPMRFRQCLLNLLSNACKFTEDGCITIKIEQQIRDQKPWILWSVADTGIGIPEQGLDKLFQTFSQVDSSETRRHGGTGLGLVISQELCKAMSGFISVVSQPNQGSTFTLHIPAYAGSIEGLIE